MNWKIGEHAIREDGQEVSLVKVTKVPERVECFGMWTESGTYFANGLLSGDASVNIPMMSDVSADKAVDMALSLNESMLMNLFNT